MENKCSICGSIYGNLIPSIHHNYLQCTFCGTQLVINKYDEFNIEDHHLTIKTLQDDNKHYDTVVKRFKMHDRTRAFPEEIHTKFSATFCIGGGFPKFETFFDTQKIFVYDMYADQYKGMEKEFRDIYNYSGELYYTLYTLDDKANLYNDLLCRVPKDNKNYMVTFIHFLEHLSPTKFHKLLAECALAENTNIHFLIYQPNISIADKPEWFHYAEGHNTFVPPYTMNKILESLGFKIIFTSTFVDDFCTIFKKA